MEEWRPIKGYEGRYEISSLGRVRSLSRVINTTWKNGKEGKYFQRGRVLKQKECSRKKGYQTYKQVCLCRDGETKYFLVHRLVAEAFLHKDTDKDVVNHKDGNKHNNSVSNLEWVTVRENILHSCYSLPNKNVSPVRCIETGKVFCSVKKAAEFAGVSHSMISMAITNKRKTAGGYRWAYNGNFIKTETSSTDD